MMTRKRSTMSNLVLSAFVVPSVVHVQCYGSYAKVGMPEATSMHPLKIVGDVLVGWINGLSRGERRNFAVLRVEPDMSVGYYSVVAEKMFVEYSQLAIISLETIFALMAQQEPGKPGALAVERPNYKPQWNVFRTQIGSEVCGLWVWLGNHGWAVCLDFRNQGKNFLLGDRIFGVTM